MKQIVITVFGLFYLASLSLAQNQDTLPKLKSNYQHLVINYNDQFINCTDISFYIFRTNVLFLGFHDLEPDEDKGVWFIDGKNYRKQYCKVQKIDTINTIRWVHGGLPKTSVDTLIFGMKMKYAFVLHKLNEKRIQEDSVKAIRLLLPLDKQSDYGIWNMVKVLFYKDSTVCETKFLHSVEFEGLKLAESKSTILSTKLSKKLLDDLNILGKYESLEKLNKEYYYWLLEYYDGKQAHLYIFSKDAKADRKLERIHGRIIRKLVPHISNEQK
ncbi:MAG: hypothetical protein HOO86_07805 [Bacteroidales bacterium]|nr:hypothetical protein [Bacteroidales bacterium]